MNRKTSLALMTENYYRNTSKPAAPLSHMRNSAGLFLGNPDRLVKNNKSPFFVIPAKRLCRNAGNHHQNRHAGAGRYPELTNNTGFRVALRLHGMTNENYDTVSKAGIQLLQNVLDTGTRTFHDVCRCNHDLTFHDLFNNISPNNTLHASRRICAPWRATFFLALNHGAA